MRILNGLLLLALCFSGVAKADDALNTTVLPSTTPTTVTVTETTAAETTVTQTVAPTTVPPTTHTPSTTQSPDRVGNWTVHEDNRTCIMAIMEVSFQEHDSKTEKAYLSPQASSDGSKCGNMTATLVLTQKNLTFTLTFTKDSSETYVSNISVVTSAGENKVSGKTYFQVANGKSYKCEADNKIDVENVTVEFSKVRLQAFGISGENFGEAEVCSDDKKNDIVPIAVAAVLVAMVVIILISYLVYRHQSRQRGYESV